MLMVTMRTFSCCAVVALVLSVLVPQSSSFVPNAARHVSGRSVPMARHTVSRQVSGAEELEAESMMNMNNYLTPEGTGFSSSMSRIAKLSKRGEGCYRANGSDRVVDVMDAITQDVNQDVALVYDEETKKLLGIFTESDYIRVCRL